MKGMACWLICSWSYRKETLFNSLRHKDFWEFSDDFTRFWWLTCGSKNHRYLRFLCPSTFVSTTGPPVCWNQKGIIGIKKELHFKQQWWIRGLPMHSKMESLQNLIAWFHYFYFVLHQLHLRPNAFLRHFYHEPPSVPRHWEVWPEGFRKYLRNHQLCKKGAPRIFVGGLVWFRGGR